MKNNIQIYTNKQKLLLVIIVLAGITLGVISGFVYKNIQKEHGIQVSVSSYNIIDAQPANPDVLQNANIKAHILTVNITSNSADTFVLLPTEYFRLTTHGQEYPLSPDGGVTNPIPGGDIVVNSSITGEISFHVPSNSQGTLQFRSSINADWVDVPLQ